MVFPPMNPELQHNPISIPPSQLGPSGHTPFTNPENHTETVTFWRVLCHWCGIGSNDQHNSTLFHTWFTQNIYPDITPKRIFYFTLSQISFFLAYGFFTQTDIYKSHICDGEDNNDLDYHSILHKARPLIFLAAAFGIHTISLIFLFFFQFCSKAFQKYRHHHLMKSLGEYIVMFVVALLVMEIGNNRLVEPHATDHSLIGSHNNDTKDKVDYSKGAVLATCGLLTVDALCIVKLLDPGHHYALLEATATLTLHLGLAENNYFRIPSAIFVLVMVMIKNFQRKHTDHAQNSTNEEGHPVAYPQIFIQISNFQLTTTTTW